VLISPGKGVKEDTGLPENANHTVGLEHKEENGIFTLSFFF
jgi:hypothetical protein